MRGRLVFCVVLAVLTAVISFAATGAFAGGTPPPPASGHQNISSGPGVYAQTTSEYAGSWSWAQLSASYDYYWYIFRSSGTLVANGHNPSGGGGSWNGAQTSTTSRNTTTSPLVQGTSTSSASTTAANRTSSRHGCTRRRRPGRNSRRPIPPRSAFADAAGHCRRCPTYGAKRWQISRLLRDGSRKRQACRSDLGRERPCRANPLPLPRTAGPAEHDLLRRDPRLSLHTPSTRQRRRRRPTPCLGRAGSAQRSFGGRPLNWFARRRRHRLALRVADDELRSLLAEQDLPLIAAIWLALSTPAAPA